MLTKQRLYIDPEMEEMDETNDIAESSQIRETFRNGAQVRDRYISSL